MFCSKCGKEIEGEVKFCKYCGNRINQDNITNEISDKVIKCKVCNKEIPYNENGTCEECHKKILERIKEKHTSTNHEDIENTKEFVSKIVTKIKNINEKNFIFFVLAFFVLALIVILITFSLSSSTFLTDSNKGTLENISVNNKNTSENNNVKLPSYIIKSDIMPNKCIFNFGMNEFIEKYNKIIENDAVEISKGYSDYTDRQTILYYYGELNKLDSSYFFDNTSKIPDNSFNTKQYVYNKYVTGTNIISGAFGFTLDSNDNAYTITYVSSGKAIGSFPSVILRTICDMPKDRADDIIDYCSQNLETAYFDEEYFVVCGVGSALQGDGLIFTVNPKFE